MNRTKNNNSILFLTTLGVYIGLLMAGASPVVIAQQSAAMTRNFDIKDEIEVKDDLDNKPDEETALETFYSSIEDLYLIARELSKDYPDRVENGQYNFSYFVWFGPRGNGRFRADPIFNKWPGPKVSSGKYTPLLFKIYDSFLPRTAEPHKKLRVTFELTGTNVGLQLNLTQETPEIANVAASVYTEALSRRKALEYELKKILISEATEVFAEDDSLVIVTRLPRAALDELLATHAK